MTERLCLTESCDFLTRRLVAAELGWIGNLSSKDARTPWAFP
ncbi:MAG TPA: hypothetical protein PLF81_14530 [Candidatus Anammoximicrobium sp.]|nr:hypothetical protein [Candidatus Anammoximicrobium sp.]